jgi:hypothetical protein
MYIASSFNFEHSNLILKLPINSANLHAIIGPFMKENEINLRSCDREKRKLLYRIFTDLAIKRLSFQTYHLQLCGLRTYPELHKLH